MKWPWIRGESRKHIGGIDGVEKTKQQAKLIEEWWTAFSKNEKKISGYFHKGPEFDLVPFMTANLQAIDKNLMWEYGPAQNGDGHRLVITPENRKDLRPLVATILNRAPALEGWEFYAYRLPEDYESAKATVEARTGAPMAELHFMGDKNVFNQLDLTFIALNARDEGSKQLAWNQAFVAIECMLGEEVLDKWIGAIEIDVHLPQNEPHRPVSELSDWTSNKIAEIRASLPDRPFCERSNSAGWTIYELKPKEKKDYSRQEDLFVGKAMCKPLWENTHSGRAFYSERFSRLGETFCYVKIDGRDGLAGAKFEDKSEIEDALDGALIGAKLGCHIGGGTGLHYSYVDFALVDLNRGVDAVKKVLRDGNITKRTWILYYDSDLESQWIGIWDDSPPPPMPSFAEEK